MFSYRSTNISAFSSERITPLSAIVTRHKNKIDRGDTSVSHRHGLVEMSCVSKAVSKSFGLYKINQLYRVSRNYTTIKVPREFTWKSKSKMFLDIFSFGFNWPGKKVKITLHEVNRRKIIYFIFEKKKGLGTFST